MASSYHFLKAVSEPTSLVFFFFSKPKTKKKKGTHSVSFLVEIPSL